MTKQLILINLALGLALGALMAMFTPFLRSFSVWHIEGEIFWLGAFIVSLLCCTVIAPARAALGSCFIILTAATLIQGVVIYLPALLNLAPNRVAYFRTAESITVFTCLTSLPVIIPGAMAGLVIRIYWDNR
jgi:uncharacterized membrane protein YwaF